MKSRLRYDPSVYVAAARVRVNADRQLKRDTPERILRLAEGDLGIAGAYLEKQETAERERSADSHPKHGAVNADLAETADEQSGGDLVLARVEPFRHAGPLSEALYVVKSRDFIDPLGGEVIDTAADAKRR